MNIHDGWAKCTQLMAELFHNKGLMYIQNSYLEILFSQIVVVYINIYMKKCSSASFEVWGFSFAPLTYFRLGTHILESAASAHHSAEG